MKYRRKSEIIDAFKWTGGPDQTEDPVWIVEALKKDFYREPGAARIIQPNIEVLLEIFTPEGRMCAHIGDYIIRNAKGEIYPRRPDVFEQTYEKVEQ